MDDTTKPRDLDNLPDAIPPLKFDVIIVEPTSEPTDDPLANNFAIGIKVNQPGGRIFSSCTSGELTDRDREELAVVVSGHIAVQVLTAIKAAMGDKEAQALLDAGDFRAMAEPFTGDDIERCGAAA